ncbi:MAG: DEAD/DEAH box helicase [Phycisphaerales bacterium]|nr:DEAD/DEAH box helicase [Phycisphaerales bacterium]
MTPDSDAKPAAKRPTRRKTTKKAPAKTAGARSSAAKTAAPEPTPKPKPRTRSTKATSAKAKQPKAGTPNPDPTPEAVVQTRKPKAVVEAAGVADEAPESSAPAKSRRRGKRGGVRNRKKSGATPDAVAERAPAGQPETEPPTPAEQDAPAQAKPAKGLRRLIPDLKARARERAAREERKDAADAQDPARDEVTESAAEREPAPEAPAPHRAPSRADAPAALAEHWDEIFGSATFADLGLRNTILRAIQAQGFVSPTKVQAALIPLALKGKDILGQSRTGTGKTAAFGLPVLNAAKRGIAYQGLILAPTRELAIQIADELRNFSRFTPLSIATVYGGQSIDQQARRLERSPEIIVATPGRLMDMLDRGHLHLKNVNFVVLDEVDRMLDIGFRDDIRAILSRIRCVHQTIFVSATISPEIEKLSRTFMHQDAERIETAAGSLTASLVDQSYISVQPWDKSKMLAYWVQEEDPELALVFCRMKRTVDKLCGRLLDRRINAAAIHGDLPQGKRNRIMDDLRAGKLHILIASDLAARGLDVDGITHVVNFDLPEDPEIYIHRIGRTARAGRGGKAFSFVTPDQGGLLTEIEKLANIHIPEKTYPAFVPNPVPDDVRSQQKADEKRLQEKRSRTRASAPELPAAAATKVDASKFPGGIVPTKMPPRRLGGRVARGR